VIATASPATARPQLPTSWLPIATSEPRPAPKLTQEQQDFAGRYWRFSAVTGRKIWLASVPRALTTHPAMGTPDDGESIGVDALLDTATRYPMPCNGCRGKRSVTVLQTMQPAKCPECYGTGAPRNQHKAIHAYLKLAILTQVRNEINKRAALCKALIGERRQTGTGCVRRGKGEAQLRGDEELEGLCVPVRVWTCRDAGQVVQGSGALALYVGLGSPYYPSDDLRAQFNPRNLACSPQQVWDAFVEEYRRGLRRVLLSPRGLAFWRPLRGAARQGGYADVVLSCDCVRADRCHRIVLAEMLATATGGIYEGEVAQRG
jgi:uncharacterized protein YeaO (DUF488 family)